MFFLTDSVYTERYMGLPTPEDNLDYYKVRDEKLDPFYNLFISCLRTFLSVSILENIYFLFPTKFLLKRNNTGGLEILH